MPIVLKKDIVASVGQWGEFETVTGGGITKQMTKHYEAGAQTPALLDGVFEFKQYKVERAYKPERDNIMLTTYENMARGVIPNKVTLTVQHRSQLGIVISQVIRTCKIIEADPPEGQSGSSDPGMVSLTLEVDESAV